MALHTIRDTAILYSMISQTPSTVDLIIIGFLCQKPMSAYELAQLIEHKHASKLVKISTPAVYKCCKRLYAEGLLFAKTSKTGAQPEKTIYSINKRGRDRFYELMTHFSSNFEPFHLNCNAFLYHLEKLSSREGLKMLQSLQEELLAFRDWIKEHEKEEYDRLPFSNRAIVKQYRMTLTTLCAWCDEVIRDYKQLKTH
ncbi:MAG: hypothetical protein AMXMBFR84_00070 [Candidatus Hydrogenedentota bacterium]